MNSMTDYNNGDQILILFSAQWCGPCRKLKSIINNDETLIQKIKDTVANYFVVDVNTENEVDRMWIEKSNVDAVPLLVIYEFQNGAWSERDRLRGFQPENIIMEWLEQRS